MSLARFSSVIQLPCVIAAIKPISAPITLLPTIFLIMTGFKRGGSRGGGFKKSFVKKRSSPDEDDSAPRASKKVKGDEDEDSASVVPELKTDDNGDVYVGVSGP